MRTADSAPEPALRTVDRALALISYLADQPGHQSLGTIALALGMNKAVVHRLLKTLGSHQYVVQDPATRAYALGPEAKRLGGREPDTLDVRVIARTTMRAIADATGFSAFLTVPLADDAICIERAEATALLRISYEAGRRHPYHAGAPGKVLLAHLDPQRRREILGRIPLQRYTKATTISPKKLHAEIDEIRMLGYACSNGELELGVGGIAAAIVDPHERPLAAISIAAPSAALTDRAIREIGGRLVRAAADIGRSFGRPANR
jgi:IclR family acetate operon transcriptional repressor